MTIEDRIQASLAHHAEGLPELRGLAPLVVAKALTLRRRRRVAAAAATGSLAAAVAVSLVLQGTRADHLGPAHPSPPPSPTRVTTPAVTSSIAPRPSTSPFVLDLPAGAPLAGPVLLMTNKVQLSVVRSGVEHQLGVLTAGVTGAAVSSRVGIVFRSQDSVDLVSPSGALSELQALPGLRGFVVSRDGRYLAWGRTVTGASGRASGQLGLYDLQTSRLVSQKALPEPGTPTGFLTDDRVAIDTDDGAQLGALLWTASDDSTAGLPKGATGVVPVTDTDVVVREGLDRCAAYVLDTATQRRTPLGGCLDPRTGSPDGKRFVALDNGAPVTVDRADGRQHDRLVALFTSKAIVADRVSWVDDTHLVLQAVSRQLDDQGRPYGKYQYLLTCTVPTTGQDSCVISDSVGPYDAARVDPSRPPGSVPFLVVNP